MIIERYTDQNESEVLNLLRLNTPQSFSPDEEKDLLHYLHHYADDYFVLKINDEVVASGGYNIAEDGITAKISWDIVHPDNQRMGFGKILTKFRIDEIKKEGGIEYLSVRTSQLAYKFYQRFGLNLRETAKDFWAKGFDMYRLDCPIESFIYPD